MPDIADTAKVYPNVQLGDDVQIGPWAIVGIPPRGVAPGELTTTIENGAIIRSHTVVYAGSRIGPTFKTGHHAVIGPGMDVGSDCSIGTYSFVAGFVRLECKARVHGHAYVGEFATAEDRAWIGPYNIIESDVDKVTVVGRGAILGMATHLYPGVRIGDRALVAMRSSVQSDMAPYRVAFGNPPRGMRTIDQVVSPNPAIGRPYKADPEHLQNLAFARHAARAGCEIADDDWRLEVWNLIRSSEPSSEYPDWQISSTTVSAPEVTAAAPLVE